MRLPAFAPACIVALVTAPVALAEPNRSPNAADVRPGHTTPTPSRRRDVRAGAFAGVGFPRPITIEAMARMFDTVGLGVEYSVLPSMTISGVQTTFWALAADARWFPFRNGFFIGFAAGYQHLSGQTTTPWTGPAGIAAETWFLNPRVGLLATTHWGLTLGVDAGIQIPVAATLTDDIPTSHPAAEEARDVARLFGKRVLPTVDLLRVGFLF